MPHWSGYNQPNATLGKRDRRGTDTEHSQRGPRDTSDELARAAAASWHGPWAASWRGPRMRAGSGHGRELAGPRPRNSLFNRAVQEKLAARRKTLPGVVVDFQCLLGRALVLRYVHE